MTDSQAAEPKPPATAPDVEAIERAVQRQIEPLLQRLKQVTLEVIDEVGRKHGNPLLAEVRQSLVEAGAAVFKTEMTALVERLRPTVRESGESIRRNADGLLGDLKAFIAQTVADVFQVQVPEYSTWFGLRVIDYLLAGTLFSLCAVFAGVGLVLGLGELGVPSFAAYLIGGGVALAAGAAVLRLRRRPVEEPGGRRPTFKTLP
jgi:hypothetical protein